LHEQLQRHLGAASLLAGEHYRAKGVDEDQARIVRADFLDDARQHTLEVAGHGVVGEIHEAHAAADRLVIEEVELLLIAQHLQWRLAQHGEVDCGSPRGGQRKHDLVGERGLAAAGLAGNEVERKLWQAAAEHLVQTRHVGCQAVDGGFGGHGNESCAGVAPVVGDQTEWSNRLVSVAPTRLASRSWTDWKSTAPAAAAMIADCCRSAASSASVSTVSSV